MNTTRCKSDSSRRSSEISAQVCCPCRDLICIVPRLSGLHFPSMDSACPMHPRPAIFRPLSASYCPSILGQRRNLTGQFPEPAAAGANFQIWEKPGRILFMLIRLQILEQYETRNTRADTRPQLQTTCLDPYYSSQIIRRATGISPNRPSTPAKPLCIPTSPPRNGIQAQRRAVRRRALPPLPLLEHRFSLRGLCCCCCDAMLRL